MKSLRFALRAFAAICVAFFMSSASCELFQNADVITFSAVLEHKFNITEEADFPGGADYATDPADEVLDAATVNADFAKHADKIESIKINKVTYVLSGYSADPNCQPVAFSNGTLTFSDPDVGGTVNVVSNVSNANLKGASDSGTVFTLPLDQDAADQISNLLKEKKKVRIHAAGRLSCTNLFLKVSAKLDCTITARVL
jgi:hypothetical protein